MRITSAAWVSETADASAGFLEFSGAGLAHIAQAMERVERRMALLGARMLEGGSAPAGGQADTGGVGAQLCGLESIVACLNESLTRVLQLAGWWLQGGEVFALSDVRFEMNSDFGARALNAEEISAIVAAWSSGAISRESMLERLQRGEVLPDGRTAAQEKAQYMGS